MRNVSFHTITSIYKGFNFEISYLIRPGHGATILYLHGLGSTKYDFIEATNQDSLRDFTIVAFDLPGSGNSNYIEGTTVDDLVELTNEVVTTLQLSDLTLIGHSMGGLTALLFAQKYQHQVKRLVSVEGNLAPEDCAILSRPTAAQSYEQFVADNFSTRFQELYAVSPYLGSRIFADTFRKNVIDRAFYDYCISIVTHSDSGQLLPLFSNLAMPRMFVYGEANRSLTYLPRLSDGNVRVVEVPDSDHWMYVDNRDFYYHAIAEFMTAQISDLEK